MIAVLKAVVSIEVVKVMVMEGTIIFFPLNVSAETVQSAAVRSGAAADKPGD